MGLQAQEHALVRLRAHACNACFAAGCVKGARGVGAACVGVCGCEALTVLLHSAAAEMRPARSGH